MYLNIVQLAESFGVEERVVEGWVRDDGLPCVHDRGRMLFDRSQTLTWAAARGLAARAGFLAAAEDFGHDDSGVRGRSALVSQLLRQGGIWRNAAAADVMKILERVVGALPAASMEVRRLLVQRLHSPAGVTWAPIGEGLALPHLRAPAALGRGSGTVALMLLSDPLLRPTTATMDGDSVQAPEGFPLTRLMFFVAPSPRAHLELLAELSRALRNRNVRKLILEGAADADIFAALSPAPDLPNDESGVPAPEQYPAPRGRRS